MSVVQNETVNVETVEKVLVVGKESSEIADSIGDLVEDIRAGKDIALITAENLQGLIKAIEGYDKLGAEMQAKSRNATIAYSGYRMANALAPVK